jgi:ribosomal protein S18 acetylase RimI-like enzyme
MEALIREYDRADESQVIDLSLRAWTPVHASMEGVMGQEIFHRLHEGDWRPLQAEAVRATLTDEESKVWVAEVGGQVVGFVSAILDRQPRLGEVSMLAVDPDHQDGGMGTALTETATEWFSGQACRSRW